MASKSVQSFTCSLCCDVYLSPAPLTAWNARKRGNQQQLAGAGQRRAWRVIMRQQRPSAVEWRTGNSQSVDNVSAAKWGPLQTADFCRVKRRGDCKSTTNSVASGRVFDSAALPDRWKLRHCLWCSDGNAPPMILPDAVQLAQLEVRPPTCDLIQASLFGLIQVFSL